MIVKLPVLIEHVGCVTALAVGAERVITVICSEFEVAGLLVTFARSDSSITYTSSLFAGV